MNKYEEALANARAGKSLDEIFPEMKESEDERIRKCLIDMVKRETGFTGFPSQGQVLTFLEKQKAKERLDRMAPIYNDKESFESALEKAWKYYNESASRTVDSFEDDYIECVFSKGFREGFLYKEKQKEQKPAEYLNKDMVYSIMKKLHDLAFSQRILINSDEYKKIKEITSDVRSLLDYPVKQKPAEWSEFDKGALNDAICAADMLGNDESFNKGNPNLAKAFRVAKDWLKSLPKRFNLQPQQEWSEEDSDMICEIIDHCIAIPYIGGTLHLSDERKKELKTFLKSLRPQPHTVSIKNATKYGNLEYERGVKDGIHSEKSRQWKPSEEQMEALESAVKLYKDTHFEMYHERIVSLYEHLKKLM